jgi:undecaprenyl-diphosphatase
MESIGVDQTLFFWINKSLANPVLDQICPFFNHAAPFVPLILIGLAAAFYHNSVRLWKIILILALAIVVTDLLVVNTLKQLIHRPRPAAILEGVRTLASGATGGHSFPSSHTSTAFLCALYLSMFWRSWAPLFISLAALVGFARIYVGVHYPSDVLGSALIGGIFGWVFAKAANLWIARAAPARTAETDSKAASRAHLLVLSAIAAIQLGRLIWSLSTEILPPNQLINYWHAAYSGSIEGLLRFPADLLAGSVSDSAALWVVQWLIHSALIFGLTFWLVGRRESWTSNAPGWLLLAALLPLISAAYIHSSPQDLFKEGDWQLSTPLLTLVFHGLVTLPLFVYGGLKFRKLPAETSLFAAGVATQIFFPFLPFWIPVLFGIPLMASLATDLSLWIRQITSPSMGWSRLIIFLLAIHCLIITLALHNPRILRKLDISFLPKNHPLYSRMGWIDWTRRIAPQLENSPSRYVLTDSVDSRNKLQLLLGERFEVLAPGDYWFKGELTKPGLPEAQSLAAWYVSEVYFAQINPRVLFIRRDESLYHSPRTRLKEVFSHDFFYKGDPFRKFHLFQIHPRETSQD